MPRVRRLRVRDVRTYDRTELSLGEQLTVIHGPNGAGKTNLLEALYLGLTGRSCRTRNDREVVRFGAEGLRVELDIEAADGEHRLAVGYEPSQQRRLTADGAPVERLIDVPFRPLAIVFLPDRLELVKGSPGGRRAHLDQLVAALWPARAGVRAAYAQALAQRNALLGRVRAGIAQATALTAWDLELGRRAVELRSGRAAAAELVASAVPQIASELGLDGEVVIAYRPRSRAETPEDFAAELSERLEGDLARGFSGHGPHRDELAVTRDGRELRSYGSQGEQRMALLALLLAERDALAALRDATPLLLLDDVMSELDPARRERLVERVTGSGQSVVTTTDLAHVPGADRHGVARIEVSAGSVREEVLA
jgi:DNA replication and repair protein RecF